MGYRLGTVASGAHELIELCEPLQVLQSLLLDLCRRVEPPLILDGLLLLPCRGV